MKQSEEIKALLDDKELYENEINSLKKKYDSL